MKFSSICIVGAPMDFGAGRRGVDMGPSALRKAGLNAKLDKLGYSIKDLGNVFVEQQESMPEGAGNAKFLASIAASCSGLGSIVEGVIESHKFPLVLGGDHSIAAGTVAGVASAYRKRGQKIGLIWIDAHTDMNTPDTTPSGNVHGMPLACCIGSGPAELTEILGFRPKVEAANVVLIGIRDVDIEERELVRSSGVTIFTMRQVDEVGMHRVMEQALLIANRGTAGFHLSLDMDAIDPVEAPGVGTPVEGGITYREAHLAMEMICDCCGMVSMEIVEVNPVLDTANRTAELGVQLVASAMGKKIL
jgi:arginase